MDSHGRVVENIRFRRTIANDFEEIERTFQNSNGYRRGTNGDTSACVFYLCNRVDRSGRQVSMERLIHASALSITAVDCTSGKICGFMCVSDAPSVSGIPNEVWRAALFENGQHAFSSDAQKNISHLNTLWLSAFYAEGSADDADDKDDWSATQSAKRTSTVQDIVVELLRSVLLTSPRTENFLAVLTAQKDVSDGHAFFKSVTEELARAYPPIAANESNTAAARGKDAEQESPPPVGFESVSLRVEGLEAKPQNARSGGKLLHLHRRSVIPQLVLRLGLMEDYDDLVPLVVGDTGGAVTPLPDNFFLDEMLRQQDVYHKVIVGEDPYSHKVVSVLCVSAVYADQQHIVSQYDMEPYEKLRDVLTERRALLQTLEEDYTEQKRADATLQKEAKAAMCNVSGLGSNPVQHQMLLRHQARHVNALMKQFENHGDSVGTAFQGQRAGHNSCRINYAYVHPAYECCARQLLPFVFDQFPFAEYCHLHTQHNILPQPAFLYDFQYVPVVKTTPMNAHGERIPLPLGLWLACRYTLHAPSVAPVTADSAPRVQQYLQRNLYGVPADVMEALRSDVAKALQAPELQSAMGSIKGSTQQVSLSLLPGIESRADAASESNTNQKQKVFTLIWDDPATGISLVAGVGVVQHVNSMSMFTLRENYQVENFVCFSTEDEENYNETNILLAPEEGKYSFRSESNTYLEVKRLFVSPVFRSYTRLFISELLRVSGSTAAVHLSDSQASPMPCLLNAMLYTPPRRVLEKLSNTASQHDFSGQTGNDAKDVDALHSLYVATTRSLFDEKITCNHRIVIVGAGATGLAALYALLSLPFVYFSNVFLVSPIGIPQHPNQLETRWEADRMEFLEREYAKLMNGYGYRVVEGSLVDLDKEDKFIMTANGECYPYDYLILTAGRQFIVPAAIQQVQQQMGAAHIDGILPLHSQASIDQLAQYLYDANNGEEEISNIILYGSSLDTYAVATTMVSRLRLSPQQLIVVSPNGSRQNAFMDSVASKQVESLLRATGTRVFNGYDVERVEYNDDSELNLVVIASNHSNAGGESGGEVGTNPGSADGRWGEAGNGSQVPRGEGGLPRLQSALDSGDASAGRERIELAASLLVCVEDKDVDFNIVSALTKRSVVFDGRVIVENTYRTSDKSIFAAGPVAMFSLRYGTSENFEAYNAREVGTHLVHIILGYMGFDEYRDAELQETPEALAAPDTTDLNATNGSTTANNNNTTTTATTTAGAIGVQSVKMSTAAQKPAQVRKLPRYTFPIARRIFFPDSFEYFIAHRPNTDLASCTHHLRYSSTPLIVEDDGEEANANASAGRSGANAAEDAGGYGAVAFRSGHRYLRVSINKQGYVEAVTYFGKTNMIDPHALRSLIGLPESLFNVVYSYTEYKQCYLQQKESQLRIVRQGEDESRISKELQRCRQDISKALDLFAYFRKPQARLLLTERFQTFFRELQLRVLACGAGAPGSESAMQSFNASRLNGSVKAVKGPPSAARSLDSWRFDSADSHRSVMDVEDAAVSATTPTAAPRMSAQVSDTKEAIKRSIARGRGKLDDVERNRHHEELTADDSHIRRVFEGEILRFLHQNKAFCEQMYYLPDMTKHRQHA